MESAEASNGGARQTVNRAHKPAPAGKHLGIVNILLVVCVVLLIGIAVLVGLCAFGLVAIVPKKANQEAVLINAVCTVDDANKANSYVNRDSLDEATLSKYKELVDSIKHRGNYSDDVTCLNIIATYDYAVSDTDSLKNDSKMLKKAEQDQPDAYILNKLENKMTSAYLDKIIEIMENSNDQEADQSQ